MNRLILTSKDGFSVSYELSRIKYIKHDKVKNLYDYADCQGNGLKASDSIIQITFIDESASSFGNNWVMTFE